MVEEQCQIIMMKMFEGVDEATDNLAEKLYAHIYQLEQGVPEDYKEDNYEQELTKKIQDYEKAIQGFQEIGGDGGEAKSNMDELIAKHKQLIQEVMKSKQEYQAKRLKLANTQGGQKFDTELLEKTLEEI